MVLNLLSTAAMTRMGRVYGNWMVSVALTNQKLRRRGIRILEEVAGVDASRAEHALRAAGHNLPTALVMLKTESASARSASTGSRKQAATCGRLWREGGQRMPSAPEKSAHVAGEQKSQGITEWIDSKYTAGEKLRRHSRDQRR